MLSYINKINYTCLSKFVSSHTKLFFFKLYYLALSGQLIHRKICWFIFLNVGKAASGRWLIRVMIGYDCVWMHVQTGKVDKGRTLGWRLLCGFPQLFYCFRLISRVRWSFELLIHPNFVHEKKKCGIERLPKYGPSGSWRAI